MTILQWQMGIMGVALFIGVTVLLFRRTTAFKAIITSGVLVAALLQLTISPSDRRVETIQNELADLSSNHPHRTVLREEMERIQTRSSQDGNKARAHFPLRLGIDLSGGTEVQLLLHPDTTRLLELEAQVSELSAPAENDRDAGITQHMMRSQKIDEVREEKEKLSEQMKKAVDIIRHRLSGIGLSEIPVAPSGKNRVIAQFPGLDDAQTGEALDTIQQQGRLDFRLVLPRNGGAGARKFYADVNALQLKSDTYNISARTHQPHSGPVEQGDILYDWLKTPDVLHRDGTTGRGAFFLVEQKVQINGQSIITTYPDEAKDESEWFVNICFDKLGALTFEQLTSEQKGRQLGILLDGKLVSAPYLTETVSDGRAYLTGQFDSNEARRLTAILQSGSLQVEVDIESQMLIGPSLGEDSIRSGLIAIAVSLVAIFLFLCFYYLTLGLVTNLALVVNLIAIMAVFSLLDATLTLPGIAALVLIMGITIDANVLIFERFREEHAAGAGLAQAMATGYDKAFSTIIDANVTTLIAAASLYFFGTDMVRGFALVMMTGIIAGMFCSLVATRWTLEGLIECNIVKAVSFRSLFKNVTIDFVSIRKIGLILSATCILISVILFGLRESAGSNYGHDFTGGALVQVQLTKPITTREARERLGDTADTFNDIQSNVQSCGLPVDEDEAGRSRYNQFTLRTRYANPDVEPDSTQLNSFARLKISLTDAFGGVIDTEAPFARAESTGAVVASETKRKALSAAALALGLIFFYIWVRFQKSAVFGLAAVLTLVHDVVITYGVLALADQLGWLNGQLDLKIIAAFLTIIGYSLNDTIVILDRIRENLSDCTSGAQLINRSLNETLGRTVITSVTTSIVALILFVFGGDAIRGFSFTLLVGVVVGTYSSIFIATPILLRSINRKMASSR